MNKQNYKNGGATGIQIRTGSPIRMVITDLNPRQSA
jgi:hypothetical protein